VVSAIGLPTLYLLFRGLRFVIHFPHLIQLHSVVLEVPSSTIKLFVHLADDDTIVWAGIWASVQSVVDMLRNVNVC
jgi:hypothetical protein